MQLSRAALQLAVYLATIPMIGAQAQPPSPTVAAYLEVNAQPGQPRRG